MRWFGRPFCPNLRFCFVRVDTWSDDLNVILFEFLDDDKLAQSCAQVVSLQEADEQDFLKPETTRQHGVTLDSRVTVTTKWQHFSHMPKDAEELKRSIKVMSNPWSLITDASPRGPTSVDMEEFSFRNFAAVLTEKRNFPMIKDLANGEMPEIPQRNHCMTYEFENPQGGLQAYSYPWDGIKAALTSPLTDHGTSHRALGPAGVDCRSFRVRPDDTCDANVVRLMVPAAFMRMRTRRLLQHHQHHLPCPLRTGNRWVKNGKGKAGDQAKGMGKGENVQGKAQVDAKGCG